MGVTVHYVDEGMDTGKIIDQMSCKIPAHWTIDDCEKQIHSMEHILLPSVVRQIAEQKKI